MSTRRQRPLSNGVKIALSSVMLVIAVVIGFVYWYTMPRVHPPGYLGGWALDAQASAAAAMPQDPIFAGTSASQANPSASVRSFELDIKSNVLNIVYNAKSFEIKYVVSYIGTGVVTLQLSEPSPVFGSIINLSVVDRENEGSRLTFSSDRGLSFILRRK